MATGNYTQADIDAGIPQLRLNAAELGNLQQKIEDVKDSRYKDDIKPEAQKWFGEIQQLPNPGGPPVQTKQQTQQQQTQQQQPQQTQTQPQPAPQRPPTTPPPTAPPSTTPPPTTPPPTTPPPTAPPPTSRPITGDEEGGDMDIPRDNN